MKTIKKYSTGISGLDTLFHGGIQIEDFHNNDKTSNENGLLIALKGSKGCNKTLFAMQLMQGLLGDFHDKNPNTTFISLNKSKSDLSDMYYDVFISKLLNELCSIYVDDNTKASDINDLILKIFEKSMGSFEICFFETMKIKEFTLFAASIAAIFALSESSKFTVIAGNATVPFKTTRGKVNFSSFSI